MNSNERNYNSRQSPGGNSSLNLGWEASAVVRVKENDEETKAAQEIHERRLENILRGEEIRKKMMKKDVKTSVKVNMPPGGTNNFSLG